MQNVAGKCKLYSKILTQLDSDKAAEIQNIEEIVKKICGTKMRLKFRSLALDFQINDCL